MGANKTYQQKGDRGRMLGESAEFRRLRHAVEKAAGDRERAIRNTAAGLHPNFPPVISRVRRLFRPLLGRVVCGFGLIFIPVFPAALHSLRAVEKLSGFGSEAGVHCTAPASSWAGQAVRAMAELP